MPTIYGSYAGFQLYHTARGVDVSAFDETTVNAAGLVASEYIDARYRSSFPGIRVNGREQDREWPRSGAIDRNGYAVDASIVPVEIENATYELQFRQLVSPGSLSVDWKPNEFKRAQVDGAVSVEYMTFDNAQQVQIQFTVVDEILSPMLSGSDNLAPLSGGSVRA